MRTALMASLFVALLFTVVSAHQGALSLYTDDTIASCSAPLPTPYATADVALVYVKDEGPDLGAAFEFVMYRERSELQVNAINWSGAITVTECSSPFNLCVGSGASCLGGQGENVVYLGTFTFIWLDFTTPPEFFIEVRENPDALPNPGIVITLCNPQQTPYLVEGGRFVFNGSCDPGVEPKSWSAIKELYRE
jgi:hypothetical protein